MSRKRPNVGPTASTGNAGPFDNRLVWYQALCNSFIPNLFAGIDGIPSDTTAVFLNVTVTDTTAAGFLTVYPNARPATSDLNWVKGQTVPNLAVATLSSGGTLNFYNATGSTDLVVDIAGWFS